MGENGNPPLCVQIMSVISLVCVGLSCIVKAVSFGLFNWWFILGGSCIMAAAFAAFRVYEVCIVMAKKEILEEQLHGPGPYPL